MLIRGNIADAWVEYGIFLQKNIHNFSFIFQNFENFFCLNLENLAYGF